MPTGTRVDKCYQKLKGSKGKSSAAAICQYSTKQSLHTGKSLRKRKRVDRKSNVGEYRT